MESQRHERLALGHSGKWQVKSCQRLVEVRTSIFTLASWVASLWCELCYLRISPWKVRAGDSRDWYLQGSLERKAAVIHPVSNWMHLDYRIWRKLVPWAELRKNKCPWYYSCGLLDWWNKVDWVAQGQTIERGMLWGKNQAKSCLTSWSYEWGILAHTSMRLLQLLVSLGCSPDLTD